MNCVLEHRLCFQIEIFVFLHSLDKCEQIVEKQNTSYEFKSTSYEFKSTTYEFKSTTYEFKSTS